MSSKRPLPVTKNKRLGFTLVEVLVAVVIMSTAVTALLTLQTQALQWSAEASQRQRALALLHDGLERARAAHALLDVDAQVWREEVQRALPTAHTELRFDGTRIAAMIAWRSAHLGTPPEHLCPIAIPRDWICMQAQAQLQ